MGLDALLLNKGYTLPGQDPNVITSPGGDPQIGGDISPMARLTRAVQVAVAKKKMDDQEKQKKLQEQMSNYQTLRDAGYSPEKAHAAAMSGDMPKGPADSSITEEATKAKTGLVQAETKKTLAEADVVGTKKSTIESQIMNKLAQGLDLNPGEQKIYDDVIKKKNNGGLAELLSQINDNGTQEGTPAAKNESVDADVPVIAPDGTRGKIKASKLSAALAKGFKRVK